MKKSDRNSRIPYVKPVQKIEVSDKHFALRVVLMALFLGLGIAAITYGVKTLVTTEPGWHSIEANASGLNCSNEVKLNYYLGGGDLSATAENRQLSQLYTQATEEAYQIFDVYGQYDGVNNLWYLNQHVNESVQVHPVLYRALEQLQEQGSRHLYLAPIYAEYNGLFFSTLDHEAERYDPDRNLEQDAYFSQITAFINDPAMIELTLMEDNKVHLYVADAYLQFAQDNAIEIFVDLHWMKNAFIVDYLAELLQEKGFTNGYVSSYDGFTRNLDERGESYSFNIYDRVDNTINFAGRMQYDYPVAMVSFRAFPLTEQERQYCYVYQDGTAVTAHIDPQDGYCKDAYNTLVCYSATKSCAEILMAMLPVSISDAVQPETGLQAMTQQDIYSIWCENQKVCYNEEKLALETADEDQEISYDKSFMKNGVQ